MFRKNQSLFRRQYYAASASKSLEIYGTKLFEDIDNLQLEFADKTR